ncbi:helix-turn-helix transcriptional regulator [Krasilnikovia sp. MM14-A1004]|uniref:helix-turn-helix transcriptional regulator n=1 Tax=Krasilnikovia sp. MM14-A1004 TaxID=3373541 RepID=UPI00399C7F0D
MKSTFAGRQSELARLEALMQQGAGLVEVTGEPGAGKSRLLEELSGRASGRNWTVVSGRAAEFDDDVPFGIFATALAPALAHLVHPDAAASAPAQRQGPTHLDAAQRALLGAAFSPAGVADPASDAGIDRYELYRAVRAALDVLAADGGLMFTVDDLHWADAGSIDLLDYLVRNPPANPVLFAVALRHRQATGRIWEVLERAEASFPLGPLTREEADELFEPDVVEPVRHQVYAASGGNPFYLETLIRAGGTRTGEIGPLLDLSMTDGALRPVVEAVSGELAALSPGALRVGRAAAVAGDRFDPEVVSAVASIPVDEALAGLDELAARDLVRPEALARTFRFRHPLVRNAVYHQSGSGWRRVAHERAVRHLEKCGAQPALRAHHLERAAKPGDHAAVATLTEAARTAALTVPVLAAHWFGVAADLLPAADGRRQELILARARALGASGRFADSRDLLLTLLAGVAPDAPLHAEAARFCATMERLLGRHEESVALLHACLQRLSDQDGQSAKALKFELAIGSAQAGRLLEALEWIGQVLGEGSDRPAADLETAGALGLLAVGNTYGGDFEQARSCIEQAMAILDGVPDSDLAQHLYVVEIAWAEIGLHRHGDARRHFGRGVASARRTGQYHLLAPLLYGLCTAENWLGDLTAARQHAEAGIEVARALSERTQYSAVLGALAEIAFLQGRLDEAEHLARQTLEALPQERQLWSGHADATLARVQLATGDPQGAIDRVLEAGDGPDLSAYALGMRPYGYDLLAMAELALGRVDAAWGWAERAAAVAPVFGADVIHRLIRARILTATGECQQAAGEARRVAEVYRAAGMRLAEGDARHVLGAALAADGKRALAQEELRRAKELFAAAGARLMHAKVVAEQRRIGAGKSRPRGGLRHDVLTERETEVAHLVAAGYSNAQIGAQLGLSVRTVETYLSKVFTKLNVGSRSGLAHRLNSGRAGKLPQE